MKRKVIFNPHSVTGHLASHVEAFWLPGAVRTSGLYGSSRALRLPYLAAARALAISSPRPRGDVLMAHGAHGPMLYAWAPGQSLLSVILFIRNIRDRLLSLVRLFVGLQCV